MTTTRTVLAGAATLTLALTACGGSDDASSDTTPASATQAATASPASGIRVVTPTEAAATIADPPADLVILDVRTPEEYAEAHIDGAVLLDFYRDDFAEQLATFDPDVPYVLYCRSGNRSSQARDMMAGLGFTSVEDVDGGIVGWLQAGLPVATG